MRNVWLWEEGGKASQLIAEGTVSSPEIMCRMNEFQMEGSAGRHT